MTAANIWVDQEQRRARVAVDSLTVPDGKPMEIAKVFTTALPAIAIAGRGHWIAGQVGAFLAVNSVPNFNAAVGVIEQALPMVVVAVEQATGAAFQPITLFAVGWCAHRSRMRVIEWASNGGAFERKELAGGVMAPRCDAMLTSWPDSTDEVEQIVAAQVVVGRRESPHFGGRTVVVDLTPTSVSTRVLGRLQ